MKHILHMISTTNTQRFYSVFSSKRDGRTLAQSMYLQADYLNPWLPFTRVFCCIGRIIRGPKFPHTVEKQLTWPWLACHWLLAKSETYNTNNVNVTAATGNTIALPQRSADSSGEIRQLITFMPLNWKKGKITWTKKNSNNILGVISRTSSEHNAEYL